MEEWKAKGYTEDEILEDKTIYDAIWEIADDYATKAGVEAGKEYREDSEAAEQARQNISSDDDESLEQENDDDSSDETIVVETVGEIVEDVIADAENNQGLASDSTSSTNSGLDWDVIDPWYIIYPDSFSQFGGLGYESTHRSTATPP